MLTVVSFSFLKDPLLTGGGGDKMPVLLWGNTPQPLTDNDKKRHSLWPPPLALRFHKRANLLCPWV